MSTAQFHFQPELDYFLSAARRGKVILVSFKGQQSLKHLIESLGVPHTEVGALLVNGRFASLDRITQSGDQVEVQPAPHGCSVEPRFLLDNHLGRLAAYLRMLGFDCLYQNDFQDDQIAEILADDRRILLTRDRRLLMRKVVQYGYCPRSLEPNEQFREVVRHFELEPLARPFHRCLRCNAVLEPVEKSAVLDHLEPKTKLYYNEFAICPQCDQVYWKGSHYERMQSLIAGLSR